MKFNWNLESHIDENGCPSIEMLLGNMDIDLKGTGLPIEGFRFLKSTKEMLGITREIENEIKNFSSNHDDKELFVGFQNVDKLYFEKLRYESLINAGVKVHAFGTGSPLESFNNTYSTWTDLNYSKTKVENQWILAITQPAPIAFIGWEISTDIFGIGKLSDPEKMFEGFATSDERVVMPLIDHLREVQSNSANTMTDGVKKTTTPSVNKIMIVTQDKAEDSHSTTNKNFKDTFKRLCSETQSNAVIYDISASTLFTKPGPPGSDYLGKSSIDIETSKLMGRKYISQLGSSLEKEGISTQIILPEKTGFRHMYERANQIGAQTVVIQDYYSSPNLLDRIAGNSINFDDLPNNFNIIIVNEDGEIKSSQNNNSIKFIA
tara:strand:+ start:774 stop:1904 length:1131 start_codon:yes stop_codon:yes gene_type:complete